MNLLPSAHRARNLCFERAITVTTQSLQEENVRPILDVSLLGKFIISQIEQAAATAFLPNIRHDVVEIPKQYRATEATMLLPLTTKRSLNQSLYISPAAAAPTPGQYMKGVDELEQQGYANDHAHQHAGALIRHLLLRKLRLTAFGNQAAGTCSVVPTAHRDIQLVGRPLIQFDAATKDSFKNPLKAPHRTTATLGHEFLHAVDILHRQPRIDFSNYAEKAYREARGYYFHDTFLAAAEPTLFTAGEPISTVEKVRQAHATPQDPFPRSTEFIDALTQLGVIPML